MTNTYSPQWFTLFMRTIDPARSERECDWLAGHLPLPEFRSVGRPILIGASRKSFIGALLELPVDERLEASLAVAAFAAARGAHLIRAHDVAATRRAVRMIDAIRRAAPASPED